MKRFALIVCTFVLCIFGLSCIGCTGNDPNSMLIPIYGTKLLYRPETYDYDTNTQNKGYYGQYAWRILHTLSDIYGNIREDTFNEYFNNSSTKSYFYDSIRYNIYSTEEVTVDGQESSSYFRVLASVNNGWNWRFGYSEDPIGLLVNEDYSSSRIENNIITSDFDENFSNSLNYYGEFENPIKYTKSFVGASEQKDSDSYTDYVKALEYVIYCMSMEIEPRAIVVANQDSKPTVSISGFANIDTALTYVKNMFATRGTIVGITPNKQKRLANYIVNNVIGSNAVNNDVVVAKVINEHRGDSETVREEVSSNNITVNRNYSEVVLKVVQNACQYVSIAGENVGEDNHLDDYFASSQIQDYLYNYFAIGNEKGHEFDHLPSAEYQSACFMFSKKAEFDNLMLFFKYDAGEDGDANYDPNASLKIRVYLNFYSQEYGYVNNFQEATITIPDGPFKYGEKTHTVLFTALSMKRGYGLQFGEFNQDIGGGVLKCKANPIPTNLEEQCLTTPKPLNGLDGSENYYKSVTSDSEELGSTYYSYGILNEEMFQKDDGCDFFEIAFEVIKTTGENNNNYKFKVGMGLITQVRR